VMVAAGQWHRVELGDPVDVAQLIKPGHGWATG
jgi:hypothetical protein